MPGGCVAGGGTNGHDASAGDVQVQAQRRTPGAEMAARSADAEPVAEPGRESKGRPERSPASGRRNAVQGPALGRGLGACEFGLRAAPRLRRRADRGIRAWPRAAAVVMVGVLVGAWLQVGRAQTSGSEPTILEPTPGMADEHEFSFTLLVGQQLSLTFAASSTGTVPNNQQPVDGKFDPDLWRQDEEWFPHIDAEEDPGMPNGAELRPGEFKKQVFLDADTNKTTKAPEVSRHRDYSRGISGRRDSHDRVRAHARIACRARPCSQRDGRGTCHATTDPDIGVAV